MKQRLALIAACLVALAVFALSAHAAAQRAVAMADFRAFYCAGSAVLHHANPYDAGPIASCESIPNAPAGFYTVKPGEILPAPVPGYVALAFAPLALLPLGVAASVYALLLLAACILACVFLVRLEIAPPYAIVAAAAIIVADVILPVGELPPFALLGITLVAWSLKDNDARTAIAGVALSMIEPQIGIAVVLSLVFLRRHAVAAIGTCVGLGVLSLAAIGAHANIEYLASVLPQHVAAELPNVSQYSIAWALHMAGVSDSAALGFSRASYVACLCAIAWVCATPFAKRRPELAILCAPALAMLGSPFLHLDHMLLALPAALAIATSRSRGALAGTFAAVVLALPVLRLFVMPALLPAAALVAPFVIFAAHRNFRGALWGTAACVSYVAFCAILIVKTGLHFTGTPAAYDAASNPTQHAWAAFVRQHFAASAWPLWFIKVPAWLSLPAIAAWVVASARMSQKAHSNAHAAAASP